MKKNNSKKSGLNHNEILLGDCQKILKLIPDNSIDLIVTDPPYGLRLMGKDWDKLPTTGILEECFRVLKPGSFGFFMSSPRQDVLTKLIDNLEKAGFETGFSSIYWAYLNGFPNIYNIGEKIAESVGIDKAKSFQGAYSAFRPKPAVEIVSAVMKPREKNTYMAQALENGKSVTWMDDCRIPYKDSSDIKGKKKGKNKRGRYSANILVSNSAVGEYSEYFDLDAWDNLNIDSLPDEAKKTYPFLFVPKASPKEKEAGLDNLEEGRIKDDRRKNMGKDTPYHPTTATLRKNTHPTVKPLKLMKYLITMGSREGDIVLDPFAGSGTTCIASKLLNRKYIGIEMNPEYHEIAVQRVKNVTSLN
ncbi:SAM-dependent methyltransferase [Desulfonema limicola]|uniref:Methyltransferase n=1 Tax=Desulfonema limicola TaxID=45656 RepID=A0A975B6R9_9BACT|nr:site-specific DNA-methyltransferase [Desulfonema limicola]QTA79846.1 SAM-dependent methyltransferase [Desulfonema limicola]